MKKLTARFRELSPAVSVIIAAALALILSCIIEIFVFRISYFTQFFGDYEELEIDLSSLPGWNGEALAVLPEDGSVSFDGLSLEVRSITVVTATTEGIVSGNIGICDEASAYKTVGAGSFSVHPGGSMNTFTVKISSHGKLTRFRINFDEDVDDAVYILKVTLNARESLSPNLLRILLIGAVIFTVLFIWRFRIYSSDYDPDRQSHRLLNLCAMTVCILISLGVLYAESPGLTLLKEYPTLEEIRTSDMSVDAYMQQLDAFEKGQIELDLDVDPELDELDNTYDTGERNKKGVAYHWDRAYYNGKYYSYFGLAPLFMVYYPVYFLTGMIPTEALACAVLAIFAIICTFAAAGALVRHFAHRANLLLFILGETAAVCGSFIYLMQGSPNFYYLPFLSATGWLAAFIALSITAVRAVTPWKRCILFVLSGISFVMIVLSRPTVAVLAVLFAIPLFVGVLRDRNLTLRQKAAESAVPFLVPVLIGAAAIMWYNYIRFDSVFEFGISYQLTEYDISYNSLSFSLKHLSGMIYHYFAEPFVYSEFFPFISLTTEKCIDFGNYLYQEKSAGLLNMPLNLGIFLLIPFLKSSKSSATGKNPPSPRRRKSARHTYLLLALGVLILGYVDFMLGGIHIRYVCDLGLIMSLVSLMLILDQIHPDGTRSAKILYALAVTAMLVTVVFGLLLIFSNETEFIMEYNPDFYLKISRLFS